MKILESKKLGFTLAEVLITLSIIGVVAAMTIPTIAILTIGLLDLGEVGAAQLGSLKKAR